MRKRKKTNKNTKTLTTLILAIIAILGVYMFLKGKGYVKGATSTTGEPFIINITEEQMKSEYNNIYSVNYSQQLINIDIPYNYETTALAKIRGEEVTFTNYYTGSNDYTTKNKTTSQGYTCLENNIMAAIISGAGLEKTGYKYTEQGTYYYSGTQLAIWEFFNTWVENSGAKENGFEKGPGNTTVIENGHNGEKQRKIAQNLAIENNYNVNIYFLKHFSHNNTHLLEEFGIGIDNQPNLILVEVLDENGNIIELDTNVEENSDISLVLGNNREDVVKAGEEIMYNISIYNKNEKEQNNLILTDTLPKGVTLVKIVEEKDYQEIELSENVDYNYNMEKRELTINIDKIEGTTTGTTTNEETEETLEYTQMGTKKYRVTVKADKLEDGTYSREIENVVKVKKEKSLLAREETTNTISDACLEMQIQELPEQIHEQDECIIGLKITNKGLITAENVNIKISIPEEILMKTYKVSILSEDGNEERTTEGTVSNEFENNSIEIPTQKTAYIQLIGSIREIKETKRILIEGTVNDEKISWTTSLNEGRLLE